MNKTINTVFEISIEFLAEHPTYTLVFQGSMDSKSLKLGRNQRNMAYQRTLNKNLEMLSNEHKVGSISNGVILEYELNTEYEAFLVKRR